MGRFPAADRLSRLPLQRREESVALWWPSLSVLSLPSQSNHLTGNRSELIAFELLLLGLREERGVSKKDFDPEIVRAGLRRQIT
jgi:hypothetical protein